MSDALLASCWTFGGDVIPGSGARSPWSFAERVEAVADAGFTGIGIDLADLKHYDLGEIGRVLAGNGITFVQLETLSGWWHGPSDDVKLLLRAAAELGAAHIKATADAEGSEPTQQLRDAFWLAAERARSVGTTLALEPNAFTSVRTVEDGARFVEAVGHPNGGLVVDLWHVMRGGSSGQSLAAALDPQYVVAVDLCDGTIRPPEGMAFLTDAVDNRLLPGDGEWDLVNFIRFMTAFGFAGPWGVEVASTAHRTLSLVEAVGRASIATRAVLQRAARPA